MLDDDPFVFEDDRLAERWPDLDGYRMGKMLEPWRPPRFLPVRKRPPGFTFFPGTCPQCGRRWSLVTCPDCDRETVP